MLFTLIFEGTDHTDQYFTPNPKVGDVLKFGTLSEEGDLEYWVIKSVDLESVTIVLTSL